jgi:lysozyme
MTAWNGNTDPSRYGWNPGADKYMARLAPGVHLFRRLKHHASRPDGYMAYGQGSSPVTVERIRENGSIATTETGIFGINFHRGGQTGTSSEGCCTVPAEQWHDCDTTLIHALTDAETMVFPFILIPGPIA